MRASPARQNFPKAAFSSPLNLNNAMAGGTPGTSPGKQAAGRNGRQPSYPSTMPTHSAFTQSSPSPGMGNVLGAGPGSTTGAFGQQTADPLGPKGQPRPPARQGPLYGASEALQAAIAVLNESDAVVNDARKPGHERHDAKHFSANQTPQQLWQSIPSGGEVAWKSSSNLRQRQRLRVARLQEALSEAASGLQKAREACKGAAEDDDTLGNLNAASLGPQGPSASLRNECAVLEAESKELEEEKAFLDERLLEVKQELARAKEALGPISPLSPGVDPSGEDSKWGNPEPEPASTPSSPAKTAPTTEDVNELAVVLRLLACLKDLATANRTVILPADSSKWTREQQVVAYFLDEVEACQTRSDAY